MSKNSAKLTLVLPAELTKKLISTLTPNSNHLLKVLNYRPLNLMENSLLMSGVFGTKYESVNAGYCATS